MNMSGPLAAKVTSALVRRVKFPRIVPTTSASSTETPHAPTAPASQEQPPGPPSHVPRIPRRRTGVPKLCPINAHRVTPYKLVKIYRQKLDLGHPVLIRNLPGFLDGQQWIDHTTDPEGSFQAPRTQPRKDSSPGFDLLKIIFESAATGRSQKDSHPSSEPVNMRVVFDEIEAECKVGRVSLEGDRPSLLQFRDWLPGSNFRDYSLDKVIVQIQETFSADPTPGLWIPFRAPLVFVRAAHQYNQERKTVADTTPLWDDGLVHEHEDPACITGLNGLVVLKETMTEEFPFPRIIRDIGTSTYHTKSCSIRTGIRPFRNNIRRYKSSTIVVGQLAGYSIATLIPPYIKALDGMPLEFHERVPRTWERHTNRFPLGSRSFALSGKTWTRDFEDELAASGDILRATLIPGDGLLVPEGWWYGIRSINNGLQLQATVTWFLGRGDADVGDEQEYDGSDYLKKYPPWVTI
ncbi:hypothetical protein F5Y03DRAFT_352830 [Xylaria venustula]|nr:hypothetical protein F5Y03DRAFT_352830 [Xylaria venustula]